MGSRRVVSLRSLCAHWVDRIICSREHHSYARTATWSDNNHLASTEYLATLYDACTAPFPEWCMMEAREKPAQVFQETSASERARLIGARQQDFSWENFGAWWYHPAPGTSRSQQEHVALHHQQIFHVDGRQSETCAEVKVCAEVNPLPYPVTYM